MAPGRPLAGNTPYSVAPTAPYSNTPYSIFSNKKVKSRFFSRASPRQKVIIAARRRISARRRRRKFPILHTPYSILHTPILQFYSILQYSHAASRGQYSILHEVPGSRILQYSNTPILRGVLIILHAGGANLPPPPSPFLPPAPATAAHCHNKRRHRLRPRSSRRPSRRTRPRRRSHQKGQFTLTARCPIAAIAAFSSGSSARRGKSDRARRGKQGLSPRPSSPRRTPGREGPISGKFGGCTEFFW